MIPFWKLQGLGNDFVFFRHEDCPDPSESFIREICDRKLGVGSDGLITLELQRDHTIMRMWNPDGSPSEMCGNGLRCAARWLNLVEGTVLSRTLSLGGRHHVVDTIGEHVQVRMGLPDFDPASMGLVADTPWLSQPNPIAPELGTTVAVSYGNPHWVWFVEQLPAHWTDLGHAAEIFPAFSRRVNVHFVVVEDKTRAQMWTWERGAGPTLACGSGACAVAAAGHATGRLDAEVTLALPGGALDIRLTPEDTFMTGPAELVFTGTWPT